MAGVNLRVATLKDANMQNCDLRSAVLAGADLEVSNHSLIDLNIEQRKKSLCSLDTRSVHVKLFFLNC